MNSNIISLIMNEYNHSPYYKKDEYICINDDRIGSIVLFKLYEKDDEIYVFFGEKSQIINSPISRSRTKKVKSLEDFRKKWSYFYNDLSD